MRVRLRELLDKLGELRGQKAPGLSTVSNKSGIPLRDLENMLQRPSQSLGGDAVDALLEFVFNEIRPYVKGGVSDTEILENFMGEYFDSDSSTSKLHDQSPAKKSRARLEDLLS